jgi:phosphoadenosine phosphosulfate reductase
MAALKSDFRLALEAGAQALDAALSGLDAAGAIHRLVAEIYPGEACVVSSFGAESAVILHLIAEAAPDTPVIFLDTGKLFDQTLGYRDQLTAHLGLKDVRTLTPNPDHLAADDPDGRLHLTNPDLCCHIRKTAPLIAALRPFKVWISGRKRHHGGARAALPRVEIQDGKLKLNPLYDWSRADIETYLQRHELPRHPLVAEGYPSIGCEPCTAQPTHPDADPRAGRWAGSEKTECGIHIGEDGTITRSDP